MERAMGIEPTSKAWEAFILPMNYARNDFFSISFLLLYCKGEFVCGMANLNTDKIVFIGFT